MATLLKHSELRRSDKHLKLALYLSMLEQYSLKSFEPWDILFYEPSFEAQLAKINKISGDINTVPISINGANEDLVFCDQSGALFLLDGECFSYETDKKLIGDFGDFFHLIIGEFKERLDEDVEYEFGLFSE